MTPAAATSFQSSLEPGDPQPAWINTAERSANVTGRLPGGIAGSITDHVAEIAASGEHTAGGEVKENLNDTDVNTKWLVFTSTAWVRYRLDAPIVVVHYALTSANDAPDRDPRDWQLQGSHDGQAWTTVDERVGETFGARLQRKEYRFANTTAYEYYRLDVTRNGAGSIVQLAEFELSNGDTGPSPRSDMRTQIGVGPTGGFVSKPRAGFSGLRALQYAGATTAAAGGHSYNKVFEVNVLVGEHTELSYVLFPEFTAADLRYPSTFAAIDLAFSDGTFLSRLGARDQHGIVLSPRAQGESKTLYTDQWNFKRADIGKVANGKTITRILVGYDSPVGTVGFRGWFDDIRIGPAPVSGRRRLSDYVVTTRGTHSSSGFSRGNNFPATALPHGFNFWSPMTDAGSTSWIYEYHRANNAQNLPQIQAFTASHAPSPWMGDRQTFQVMPAIGAETGRAARALAFRHENEIARPYHYSVVFENGVRTEITPTDHAAVFRFRFPQNSGRLIFDNVNSDGGLTLGNGVVTGYSDVRSGLSTGATRMYYYAEFDRPITSATKRGTVLGVVEFGSNLVTMRIASSLISIEQARANLRQEISPTDTFDTVKWRAQKIWDDKLRVVEVEDATEDQLVTLYSNLYRLFLYPNSGHENVGGVIKHAVQSATATVPDPAIVDGKVYVNNGFWDTYRTTWPAYALLTPRMAGEMVEGFVQQYRDGGWIARWSSPGYADLMVGTSSDVAFADAYLKGVTGFDAQAAYEAALRNATVVPPTRHVGRKGLDTSQFLGYTSVQSTGEAMSWAMDGYINDFGIANMAAALGRAEEAEYFRNRALNYVHMFDPAVGFFQGRNEDGSFRVRPGAHDPHVWGFDYTETNAWNMAFHAPQDGRGLANLYGGTAQLARKLDEFFATPETATFPGSYGGIIHEMREARDARMGQYGHPNQPSHHIVYMYNHVGQPWKTQALVREALSRLYLGSEIGQGYPGDEDNGEMSAWQIFSALGFYPLMIGSPYYAIGSPLFTKATIHLEGGRDLVIRAPGNNARNVCVQGMLVNGKRHDKTYLAHDVLAAGGEILFQLGPQPSRWGTGPDAAPPSLTTGEEVATPLADLTRPNGNPLFDNDSATSAAVPVAYEFASAQRVTFYTLSSQGEAGADPESWTLEGSTDGAQWTVVDRRAGERFAWRMQTRPFKVANPGLYKHYRLQAAGRLSEVELMSPAPPETSAVVLSAQGAVAAPGETVPVSVTVTNHGGTAAASGRVTAVQPVLSADFGPLAPGASQTVTFEVTVAETTSIGFVMTSNAGSARATAVVTVVTGPVEFTPGTASEAPWLLDPGASQLDGEVYDGRARFTDGNATAVYHFPIRRGATVTLDIGNQFRVEISADGQNWQTVLHETENVRDLSNRMSRGFAVGAGGFYLRLSDSLPGDGWGGWLARIRLDLADVADA